MAYRPSKFHSNPSCGQTDGQADTHERLCMLQFYVNSEKESVITKNAFYNYVLVLLHYSVPFQSYYLTTNHFSGCLQWLHGVHEGSFHIPTSVS
jgi:hypothetical protein